MDLTSTVKRAPKWAWYTAAGVTAGAIGLKFWRGRAADTKDASTDPTVIGTPDTGSPSYSPSPVPTVTPPVIIAPDNGDNGTLADLVTAFTGTFSSSLDNAVNAVTGLAAGDQAITQSTIGILGQNTAVVSDLAREAIAQAGSPPAPAVQNPTPIIVNIPAPAAAAPAPAPAHKDPCTGEFPLQETDTRSGRVGQCYKVGQTGHGRFHIYKSGQQWKVPGS